MNDRKCLLSLCATFQESGVEECVEYVETGRANLGEPREDNPPQLDPLLRLSLMMSTVPILEGRKEGSSPRRCRHWAQNLLSKFLKNPSGSSPLEIYSSK